MLKMRLRLTLNSMYIESKEERPRDQPEVCEIETVHNVLSKITGKLCVLKNDGS